VGAGAGRWLRPAGDTDRAGLKTQTGGAAARSHDADHQRHMRR
jgi:hypothetical protein